MHDPVTRLARGTWLQGESFAYPNGGQSRRGQAIYPDGTLRMVYAGIPDTYFSIPAHGRIAGHYVAGYLTTATASGLPTPTDDDPAFWTFVPYTGRPCRSTYGGARFDTGRAVRCDGTVPVGWADGSRGTCSMVTGTGRHGNGFAARYWED